MLVEFRFKNFLSFRDEQVLSLVASSDKTMLEQNTARTRDLGKKRLLRSAVIYGANASGKSNVFSAFAFVRDFVKQSASKEPGASIPLHPFLLDRSSATKPSEFEITFIHNGVRYQYGFMADRSRVHEEWLFAYPKGLSQCWFRRGPAAESSDSDWYFGPHLKGEKERIKSLTRPDVLFLSAATQFNHAQLSAVYEWFSQYLRVLSADTDHGLITATIMQESADSHARIKNLLCLADLGIAEVSVEAIKASPEEMLRDIADEDLRKALGIILKKFDTDTEVNVLDVQLQHRAGDRESGEISLPMESESKGTQRLFSVAGPWIDTLDNGYAVVVDELDTSLHPLLAKELVSMFHRRDLNVNNAQLICNTHDTTLLDHDLFRRDQIWFVEKDNTGASHLYPLLEFSPRKGEALERGYLRGRYGAIPVLGDLSLLQEESPNGKD